MLLLTGEEPRMLVFLVACDRGESSPYLRERLSTTNDVKTDQYLITPGMYTRKANTMSHVCVPMTANTLHLYRGQLLYLTFYTFLNSRL